MGREPLSADEFHAGPSRVYAGDPGWAVYKQGGRMARVAYSPAHPNPSLAGPRAGQGRTVATWVFSEEDGTGEGLFQSGLDLVMDTRLDPCASVGLHRHDRTEEVYYVLEGSLTVTTVGEDGQESTCRLGPGDAHAIRVGQSHCAQAGDGGARFLSVGVRCPR